MVGEEIYFTTFIHLGQILTYLRAGGGQFAAVGVHDGTSAQQLLENTTNKQQCHTKYEDKKISYNYITTVKTFKKWRPVKLRYGTKKQSVMLRMKSSKDAHSRGLVEIFFFSTNKKKKHQQKLKVKLFFSFLRFDLLEHLSSTRHQIMVYFRKNNRF